MDIDVEEYMNSSGRSHGNTPSLGSDNDINNDATQPQDDD